MQTASIETALTNCEVIKKDWNKQGSNP